MTTDQLITLIASILIPLGSAIVASHVRTGNRLTALESEVKHLKDQATSDAKIQLLEHCAEQQMLCPARRDFITGIRDAP